MSQAIFLLGAGASMEAGLPSVAQMTRELRERLPDLKDINGRQRPEFPALFDAIARNDREVTRNYERFFEWLAMLVRGQRDPFNRIVRLDLGPDLAQAAGELA